MTTSLAPPADFGAAAVRVKPWGHEKIFAAGEHGYVGKIITVDAGHSLSLQYHHHKDETITVITGEATIDHGPSMDLLRTRTMRAGDVVHLAAGALHRVTAVSDVVLAEVSTAPPGWQADIVRLSDRYGRDGTTEP